jgi:hypothetical protein
LPVVLLVSAVPPAVRAQEATPTSWAGEAVDPAACQVAPITAERLTALWFPAAATPGPATPRAASELTSVPLPLGEPADPATAVAITTTVRELIACQNRMDNGRVWALFTDNQLRQFGPPPDIRPEDIPALLAPPLPEEPIPVEWYTRLFAVTDVSVMADGRVATVVVSDDPWVPGGPVTEIILFLEEGGRWLIGGGALFTTIVSPPEGFPPPVVADEGPSAAASTPVP